MIENMSHWLEAHEYTFTEISLWRSFPETIVGKSG